MMKQPGKYNFHWKFPKKFLIFLTSLTWLGRVGGNQDIECAPSADDNWSNESKNIHNGCSAVAFSNRRLKWFVNWDNSTGIVLSGTSYNKLNCWQTLRKSGPIDELSGVVPRNRTSLIGVQFFNGNHDIDSDAIFANILDLPQPPSPHKTKGCLEEPLI